MTTKRHHPEQRMPDEAKPFTPEEIAWYRDTSRLARSKYGSGPTVRRFLATIAAQAQRIADLEGICTAGHASFEEMRQSNLDILEWNMDYRDANAINTAQLGTAREGLTRIASGKLAHHHDATPRSELYPCVRVAREALATLAAIGTTRDGAEATLVLGGAELLADAFKAKHPDGLKVGTWPPKDAKEGGLREAERRKVRESAK